MVVSMFVTANSLRIAYKQNREAIVQILNVIAKALPTGRIARIVQIDLSRVSSFLAVKVY